MSFFPTPPLPAGAWLLVKKDNGTELYTDKHGALYTRWVSSLGSVLREEWTVPTGRPHREGGLPALIRYGPSGRKLRQEWFVDGRLSRLDGPAMIDLSTTKTQEWFVSSIGVTQGNLGSRLLGLTPDEIEREVACSVYAHLLVDEIPAVKIAAALDAGLFDVTRMRAHIEGAPVEWIRAFEAGVQC